jgi:hypothetical protein
MNSESRIHLWKVLSLTDIIIYLKLGRTLCLKVFLINLILSLSLSQINLLTQKGCFCWEWLFV